MRVVGRLLQHASRVTLFTRANCSLCDQAKLELSRAWEKKPFEFKEVDIMACGQEQWKDVYEFDTPVVSEPSFLCFAHCCPFAYNRMQLHVEKAGKEARGVASSAASGLRKAMHRFSEQQILQLLEEVEAEQRAEA